ncbi:MAG: AbrB/MazE/SpoVT family DNA-binding domain-containing protein [Thermoleophilaceae bacterium]|jgi:AbrB family looped-hinge helix DNA binding protein|nr:AbrB/MazE/SpoVT family DNA-binding domain-containing protein [Thermoleophilaceae bacterium]MBA3840254.1 AbrB/MazE/SpoVT family DNA-binding domain-containing protein [Thermoleophilaceae bacterium]
MRITSKGQVTIPQELRERYGLGAGTEVEVVASEEGALIRALPPRDRGAALVAQLRDRADGGIGADAVLRLTRGEA